jgi:hypothetical protein
MRLHIQSWGCLRASRRPRPDIRSRYCCLSVVGPAPPWVPLEQARSSGRCCRSGRRWWAVADLDVILVVARLLTQSKVRAWRYRRILTLRLDAQPGLAPLVRSICDPAGALEDLVSPVGQGDLKLPLSRYRVPASRYSTSDCGRPGRRWRSTGRTGRHRPGIRRAPRRCRGPRGYPCRALAIAATESGASLPVAQWIMSSR